MTGSTAPGFLRDALRWWATLSVAMTAGVAAGCADDLNPLPRPPIDRVVVEPDGEILTSPNQTLQLTAVALDSEGREIPNQDFVWSTSATSVVTVNREGLVSVVGSGQSRVVATLDGVSGSVTVLVDLNGGPVDP